MNYSDTAPLIPWYIAGNMLHNYVAKKYDNLNDKQKYVISKYMRK